MKDEKYWTRCEDSTGWVELTVTGPPMVPAGKVTSQDLLKGLYTIRDNNLAGLSGAPLTFVEGQPKKLVNCLFYIRIKEQQWIAPYGSKPTCVAL